MGQSWMNKGLIHVVVSRILTCHHPLAITHNLTKQYTVIRKKYVKNLDIAQNPIVHVVILSVTKMILFLPVQCKPIAPFTASSSDFLVTNSRTTSSFGLVNFLRAW